jgi:hypothetical protein
MATKTEIAIRILKANVGKSLTDVIPLLMKECDLSEKNANACYRLRIKADPSLALSGSPAAVKATVKRMAKEIVTATAKAKPKSKEVKAETLLPASEVAKIKAANLARLKAVSAKTKQYTNVARPEGTGVDGFDADEARAEVSGMIDSLESFKAPKFLSKAQVKALV